MGPLSSPRRANLVFTVLRMSNSLLLAEHCWPKSLVLEVPVIRVLDEVLVTEVSSSTSGDEIAEKGIVVDEDSQVLNFAVGMQIDGEDVEIELSIALPNQGEDISPEATLVHRSLSTIPI